MKNFSKYSRFFSDVKEYLKNREEFCNFDALKILFFFLFLLNLLLKNEIYKEF